MFAYVLRAAKTTRARVKVIRKVPPADSKHVIIIYRVDRHAPLKAVSYRVDCRRARCIKGPFDVKSNELMKYWQSHSSATQPSPKIFGTPRKHE